MQEDIENRAVTLIISTTKFSGRTLKAAIVKLMQQMEKDAAKRKQKDTIPHGSSAPKPPPQSARVRGKNSSCYINIKTDFSVL